MKSKGHVGGIIDKRFGENNPHLTPEEKMLERFTRERQVSSDADTAAWKHILIQRSQKHAKQATFMFNLDDDDEDIQLTHYGQSLAEIDDFDDTGLRLSDDEDDKGQLSKEMVSQMHFGGFEDGQQTTEDGKPKSRSEIMKEIIAKSKFYKVSRKIRCIVREWIGINQNFKCSMSVRWRSKRTKPCVKIWMKNWTKFVTYWI